MYLLRILFTLSILFFLTDVNAQTKWVQYTGSTPAGAVVTGQNDKGKDLVVCRCELPNGTNVGKIIDGKCRVGSSGKIKNVADFEVLISKKGTPLKWVELDKSVPLGAQLAGRGLNIFDVYVTRIKMNGYYHPAKAINYGVWYAFTTNDVAEISVATGIEILIPGKAPEPKLPPSTFNPQKGFYLFSPGQFKNMAISIENRFPVVGKKITIEKGGSDYSQYFKIIKEKGGYFRFQSASNKLMYLTPSSNNPQDGTGFELQTYQGDHQRFRIYKTRAGMHNIASAAGDNLYLGIHKDHPGKLVLREGKVGIATAFLIRKSLKVLHEENFELGNLIYMANAADNDLKLNTEQFIMSADKLPANNDYAQWVILPGIEKGTYFIRNLRRLVFMKNKNGKLSYFGWDNSEVNHFLWRIKPAGNNKFTIESVSQPGKYVVVKNDVAKLDSNGQNTDAGKWQFPTVKETFVENNLNNPTSRKIQVNDHVRIVNFADKSTKINNENGPVVAGSIDDNAWSAQWVVSKMGDGYVIKNRYYQQYLKMTNGKLELVESVNGFSNAMVWKMEEQGATGYYKLMNAAAPDQYLVPNGGKLTTSTERDTPNEAKWAFIPVR